MILGIETATNVCSVAYCDNHGEVQELRTLEHGTHSEKLFLFIEELMDEHSFSISDLDAVLISEGPGSYTGLRIGASAVKGLLFQQQVTLYGVNTLASFAMQAILKSSSATTIHSIIDARRVHVYHQQFSYKKELTAESEITVMPIDQFESVVNGGDIIIGTGLNRLSENILEKAHSFGTAAITARSLIRLFEEEADNFYRKENPGAFTPRYYTSNQVR